MLFHRVIVAIGLCLLAAGVRADGTEATQTAVKLYRGASIIAASDPKSAVYRPNFTPEACRILKAERWKAEAKTKTSGAKVTYNCQTEERSIISFHPAPVLTCGVRPGPDEQKTATCPSGTVGTWVQDKVWTLNDYPTCWTQGEWTPSSPPAGMCAPVTPAGTATLRWVPPTKQTDGSPLTTLAGYRVHYGTSPSALAQSVQVPGAGVSAYTLTGLAAGTYFFSLRSYTSDGNQSALSTIVSKVVQ